MKQYSKLTLIMSLILSLYIHAQQSIIIGEKTLLFSKILNEEREIWLHLPKSYNDQTTKPRIYPVIYLLDAEINFEYFAPTVDYLSKNRVGNIPECIVVGIKNTNRTRDFTPTQSAITDPKDASKKLFAESGGAEMFLKFLLDELKPFINKNYRTSNFSVLVGHSFGGLFATYTFLQNPKYFDAYIINDPSLWWYKKVLLSEIDEKLITSNLSTKIPFYLAQANNATKKSLDDNMANAIEEFRKKIENRPVVDFGYKFYENDNHGTVSYPGSYDGLKFIFKNYANLTKLE